MVDIQNLNMSNECRSLGCGNIHNPLFYYHCYSSDLLHCIECALMELAMNCRRVMTSTFLHCINHTHMFHLHNSSVVSHTLDSYMLLLHIPPTADEMEGATTRRTEILKLHNCVQSRHSPGGIQDWQKKRLNMFRYRKWCYLILESKPPQQPPSDGYIMLWIKKRQLTLLSQIKLALNNQRCCIISYDLEDWAFEVQKFSF